MVCVAERSGQAMAGPAGAAPMPMYLARKLHSSSSTQAMYKNFVLLSLPLVLVKFRSFNEQIASLKIDVVHRIGNISEQPEVCVCSMLLRNLAVIAYCVCDHAMVTGL